MRMVLYKVNRDTHETDKTWENIQMKMNLLSNTIDSIKEYDRLIEKDITRATTI